MPCNSIISAAAEETFDRRFLRQSRLNISDILLRHQKDRQEGLVRCPASELLTVIAIAIAIFWTSYFLTKIEFVICGR